MRNDPSGTREQLRGPTGTLSTSHFWERRGVGKRRELDPGRRTPMGISGFWKNLLEIPESKSKGSLGFLKTFP